MKLRKIAALSLSAAMVAGTLAGYVVLIQVRRRQIPRQQQMVLERQRRKKLVTVLFII